MVKHKRIAHLSRIAVIVVLVVALCLACVSPGYGVIVEASIIVPAVIAALAAFGIGTSVRAMQSGDIISWYTQKLEQWALSVGQTVSTLLDVAKLTTDPLGMLRLAPSFLLNVKAFAQWLQTDMGVTSGGSPVVTRLGNFTNMPMPKITGFVANSSNFPSMLYMFTAGSYPYRVKSTSYNDQYCFLVGNYVYFCRTSNNVDYDIFYQNGDSYKTGPSYGGTGVTLSNGVYYHEQFISGTLTNVNIPVFSSVSAGTLALYQYLNGNGTSITLTPDTVIDYPDTAGDDEEDMPYVIDYGGVAGDSVQDAADTVMQKVISNDLVIDGAIETPAEEMEWSDIMSPRAVNGLDDIFPFCIPFDVYHFFQAMISTPTAPHFEVPFVVPGLVNYTFVLDFAQFNTVAQIFRTMELLCFCIGLALATRRLIRG